MDTEAEAPEKDLILWMRRSRGLYTDTCSSVGLRQRGGMGGSSSPSLSPGVCGCVGERGECVRECVREGVCVRACVCACVGDSSRTGSMAIARKDEDERESDRESEKERDRESVRERARAWAFICACVGVCGCVGMCVCARPAEGEMGGVPSPLLVLISLLMLVLMFV